MSMVVVGNMGGMREGNREEGGAKEPWTRNSA